MLKYAIALAVCLLPTAAVAATPQELCNGARLKASRNFEACVRAVEEKSARGAAFDIFKAFAACRHTYFSRWAGFQGNDDLQGTSCVGARFVDNGDGSVSDALTGLTWETKLNSTPTPEDPRRTANTYTWSTGSPLAENGLVFTSFLSPLNAGEGFAFANGWRLPTLAELQTILLDFRCGGSGGGPTCRCPAEPCIDPTVGAHSTPANTYWTVTTYLHDPAFAWAINFLNGNVSYAGKTERGFARAVRGGL